MNVKAACVLGVMLLIAAAMVCAAFRYEVATPHVGYPIRLDRWTGQSSVMRLTDQKDGIWVPFIGQ